MKHIRHLNRLLRWTKRKSASIAYRHISGSVVLACIGDSAFRAEDDGDCLALRGVLVAVVTMVKGRPNGPMHVIEFFSKKQRRVTRSTFGAELHNLCESTEIGMLLAGFFHELEHGACSAQELAKLSEEGKLAMPVHGFVDAESVFSAVTATEIGRPLEANLLYPVRALREHLEQKRISQLHWLDTRDMLADALTKGSVSREAILSAFAKGTWRVIHEVRSWPATR
jgi:hypothetical protein